MSNPAFIDCPAGAWTKIATNVVSGNIYKMITEPQYLQTYRLTGEAAPTLIAEGVQAFIENPEKEIISAIEPIDAYLWCIGAAGRVRIDI